MIILNSFSDLLIHVRISKAKSSDKKKVLDFCKNTFSWGDYIEDVWDYWILEGNLLVLRENKVPLAICHSSFFEKQVWIEGIRVNEKFRKKGFAKSLVLESELRAKRKKCNISKMLIASNNKKSLNLAKNLKYQKESIWNFYSLPSKKSNKKQDVLIASDNKQISKFLSSKLSSYVKSWRWIPLTKKITKKLVNQKRILYTRHKSEVDTMLIFAESEHFDKTLMVTLVPGSINNTKEILTYIQVYAFKNKIKRIQILTKAKSLPRIKNLEKRFVFCLVTKKLN